MLFEKKRKYTQQWKETTKKIKEAFGWKCALCRREHALEGKGSILGVHHIDGDSENDSKENLLVLCFSCHVKVDREAEQYFLYKDIQLSFCPDMDYLSAMKDLWKEALQ